MAKVNHGKRLFKGMSLEVAVRNPERYLGILKVFSLFNGKVLDDNCILEIYIALYTNKVIESNKLKDSDLTHNFLASFIKTSITHNNEWGFPTGYQAAFTRYLKTLSEFGFIYSQYNEVFELSQVAKLLLENELTLSEAFALQSLKFWRKSPYRRVLNDFNYFKFIVGVLFNLSLTNRRLTYNEFVFSLFSIDGDVSSFVKTILGLKLGNNSKKAYRLIKKTNNLTNKNYGKVPKFDTVFRDYANSVFRLLQLTGFITVESQGLILLTINKNRIDLFNELNKIISEPNNDQKEDAHLYYLLLQNISSQEFNLLKKYREKEDLSTELYNSKLSKLISDYSLDKGYLSDYLLELAQNKDDKKCFWFIQAPLKLELLLTLFVYSCYGDTFMYKPNYKCDDAGIPYSHAPGNIGDIEIYNSDVYWLLEATLIRNKVQQMNYETINLFRHISKKIYSKKYLSLVAPFIHEDTKLLINTATIINLIETNGLNLYSNAENIDEFVKGGLNKENLQKNEINTSAVINNLKNNLGNLS
jgi:hypothetical protein